MTIPEDRRYTDQHEWALMVDGKVRIGITDYAQDALGDVVFVDLPAIGRRVGGGETLAEVESTKSVAEVYAPCAGAIAAVNTALADAPRSDQLRSVWRGVVRGVDSGHSRKPR